MKKLFVKAIEWMMAALQQVKIKNTLCVYYQSERSFADATLEL